MTTEISSKKNLTPFWESYNSILRDKGIVDSKAYWLVHWAEMFARSMAKPLKSRTLFDIQSFVDKLNKEPKMVTPLLPPNN